MTTNKQLKVGLFYDGSHVYHKLKEKFGSPEYFNFKILNECIEQFISVQIHDNYRISYKGWYEGIYKSYFDITTLNKIEDVKKLRTIIRDYYNTHINNFRLVEGGIETTYLPRREGKEKGIDVALAIAVANRVETLRLNTVVLLTNDSDFAPLIHNLKTKGVDTISISFDKDSNIAEELEKRVLYATTFDEIITYKKATTSNEV